MRHKRQAHRMSYIRVRGRLMLYICPKVISMISNNKDNNNKMRGDLGYDIGSIISQEVRAAAY